MTPALKAMVAAMADELKRQAQAGERVGSATLPMKAQLAATGPLRYQLAGRFDLEKVARAGLAAISEPDETIRAGGAAADAAADPFIGTEHEGVPADPADAAEHWRFMIGAILSEKA